MPTTRSWAGGCPLGAEARKTRRVVARGVVARRRSGEQEARARNVGAEGARNRSAWGERPGAAGMTRLVPNRPGGQRCWAPKKARRGARQAEVAACGMCSARRCARLPRPAATVATRAEAEASRIAGRCPSSRGSERSSRPVPAGRQARAGSWVRSSRIRRGPSCSPWPVLLRPGAVCARGFAVKVCRFWPCHRAATRAARNFVGVDWGEWTARDRKSTPCLFGLRSGSNCSRRAQSALSRASRVSQASASWCTTHLTTRACAARRNGIG
jgi:hypothetical protein